jgi:hypothetical protein
MNLSSIQDRNGELEEYLQLLHSMAFELERAMSAISQNSIKPLEESLANQEVFSARLLELADHLNHPAQATSPLRLPAGDDLMQQIHAASSSLQTLNRRYAALLKLSSQSVAMMVSLFSSYQGQISSYQGQIQEGSGSRLKRQTWSCQI